jgi:hydroxyacid-oxoacid transhydrogenase
MPQPAYYTARENGETIFSVAPSSMKFGAGALAELGEDAVALGMKRVAFFTEPNVAAIEPAQVGLESLRKAGLDVAVYDACRVEPTDGSLQAATAFAAEGAFDGFVSVSGGSVMDTAKAANLYSTWPDDFLSYVNAPVGGAKPVPGPLKPHIACPTTCGTGAEVTAILVFDLTTHNVKTAIRNPAIKPTMAVVDPLAAASLPAGVVASTGFDVLTHALESYLAVPFTDRDRPARAADRPPYQGANPWGDMGSLEAIRLGGRFLVPAVVDADAEARANVMFAATLAGLAFGNAGVQIPHATSYAVAGLNHEYVASGYEKAEPMVPHGLSVLISAPAAFRFTGPATPERHLTAAAALGADVSGADPANGGDLLARRLIDMMRETGLPNGLGDLGFGETDIPELVRITWSQQRQLLLAPRPVTEAALADIFRDALRYW